MQSLKSRVLIICCIFLFETVIQIKFKCDCLLFNHFFYLYTNCTLKLRIWFYKRMYVCKLLLSIKTNYRVNLQKQTRKYTRDESSKITFLADKTKQLELNKDFIATIHKTNRQGLSYVRMYVHADL